MKSEFVVAERRKLETRQSVRRRRMPKQTSANGREGETDCSVNMVAAIQDHISCTKSADILKIQEPREDKVTLACELDHMYANCGDPKPPSDDSQPMKQLKELLLFHLDLVQQQEEQIKSKDRQLSALKEEKESLKQRLDRMERCMTFVKQKEKVNDYQQQLPSTDISDNTRAGGQDRFEMPSTPSSTEKVVCREGRKMKRKCSTDMAAAVSPMNNTDLVADDKSNDSNSSDSTEGEEEDYEVTTSPVSTRDILRTDDLYFSNYNSAFRRTESPSRVEEEEVLVPSWRIHPVTSCYQLEGTENLDDEVFLKRHQKLEIDERRRKRWDIQRLREQRMNEKLKRGRSMNKDNSFTQDFENYSFFPNPDDAQFLEVSDTVPVCAFGYPVPNFQPCEFTLPWSLLNSAVDRVQESVSERLRSSSNNSKRLRTSDGKRGS